MTAVIEGTDLSWVTFGSDDGERCGAIAVDCPREAVAAAFWEHICLCTPDRQPLCTRHRDSTAAKAARNGSRFSCALCGDPLLLLRIEPIR